jgi:hypothetical protein
MRCKDKKCPAAMYSPPYLPTAASGADSIVPATSIFFLYHHIRHVCLFSAISWGKKQRSVTNKANRYPTTIFSQELVIILKCQRLSLSKGEIRNTNAFCFTLKTASLQHRRKIL